MFVVFIKKYPNTKVYILLKCKFLFYKIESQKVLNKFVLRKIPVIFLLCILLYFVYCIFFISF